MTLRLFEYAVICQPKIDKDGETIEKGEVVVPVTTVLAKDESQVNLLAARQIPEEYTDSLDRVQVVVRPFLNEDPPGWAPDFEEVDRHVMAAALGGQHVNVAHRAQRAQAMYTSANTLAERP